MDIFNAFATDAKLEVEGRWVSLSKDASVLVARSGNERFTNCMKRLLKKHAVNLKDESKENNELVEKLVMEATAETILLDWKGLTYRGTDLPYSKENALKALAHKDFRAKIQELSEQSSAYLVSEIESQGND